MAQNTNNEIEIVEIEVPEDAGMGDLGIMEMGINVDLERVYVELYDHYGGEDRQLIFLGEMDGYHFRVTGVPAGMVPPAELPERRRDDSPGSAEAREMYEVLESVGITVVGFDE